MRSSRRQLSSAARRPGSGSVGRSRGTSSRRRDCHFTGAPSSSLSERLLKEEGGEGGSSMTVSPTARHEDSLQAAADRLVHVPPVQPPFRPLPSATLLHLWFAGQARSFVLRFHVTLPTAPSAHCPLASGQCALPDRPLSFGQAGAGGGWGGGGRVCGAACGRRLRAGRPGAAKNKTVCRIQMMVGGVFLRRACWPSWRSYRSAPPAHSCPPHDTHAISSS